MTAEQRVLALALAERAANGQPARAHELRAAGYVASEHSATWSVGIIDWDALHELHKRYKIVRLLDITGRYLWVPMMLLDIVMEAKALRMPRGIVRAIICLSFEAADPGEQSAALLASYRLDGEQAITPAVLDWVLRSKDNAITLYGLSPEWAATWEHAP